MRKALLTAGCLLAAGCVAPQVREGKVQLPPDVAEVAKKNIEVGRTTKKEVLEVLGPPDSKMLGTEIPTSGAQDIWIYKQVRSSRFEGNVSLLVAGGGSSTSLSATTVVIVYFDDRGVVKEFSARQPETR